MPLPSHAYPHLNSTPFVASTLRRSFAPLLLLAFFFLPACSTDLLVPMTRPTTGSAPTAPQVQAALAQWPQQARRPFFATIHAAGHRVTASGVLDYHSPYDFRITTITELGQILFDARYNWAGVHVLRIMPDLSPTVVETLCHDISLSLRPPPSLEALQVRSHDSLLVLTSSEHYTFTYDFANPDAQLHTLDIKMGAFDTLYVTFPQYTPAGAPKQISLARPLRAYSITLTFTDPQ